MTSDWDELILREQSMPYFAELQNFVAGERAAHTVHPPEADVFVALRATPLDSVRVVILGQDPYHGHGQAHGLSFSVRDGVRIPPSLRNILAELHEDTGAPVPSAGDLTPWAHQGVLLLNTVLTVRDGEAGSHAGHGWETFTDRVIESVNALQERVVFVLWGAHARAKRQLVSNMVHSVIESAHPSPLSARNGFFGSRPFTRTNELLREAGRGTIDWDLSHGDA